MKTSAALRGIYLPVLGLALLLGQLAFGADAPRPLAPPTALSL